MKLILLAMRDIKAANWKPPMAVTNIPGALRDLADMISKIDGQEDWQRHPEDFELYDLGTFDTDTGRCEPKDHQNQICVMANLKR